MLGGRNRTDRDQGTGSGGHDGGDEVGDDERETGGRGPDEEEGAIAHVLAAGLLGEPELAARKEGKEREKDRDEKDKVNEKRGAEKETEREPSDEGDDGEDDDCERVNAGNDVAHEGERGQQLESNGTNDHEDGNDGDHNAQGN